MGVGLIAVTPDVLAQILHAPVEQSYRLEEVPADTIQSALLLPEGYTVNGIAFDPCRGCYCIYVEHSSFPEVPQGHYLPEVKPTYQLNADTCQVRIVKFDMWIPEDGHPWHPQPLPE